MAAQLNGVLPAHDKASGLRLRRRLGRWRDLMTATGRQYDETRHEKTRTERQQIDSRSEWVWWVFSWDDGVIGGQHGLSRGLSCECCVHMCTYDEMIEYCHRHNYCFSANFLPLFSHRLSLPSLLRSSIVTGRLYANVFRRCQLQQLNRQTAEAWRSALLNLPGQHPRNIFEFWPHFCNVFPIFAHL